MIIVVEGPNGVGKTTFAKQLAEKYNLTYIKEHQPGFKFYIDKALEYDNCVLDRFHLGEYVYPLLKKDGRIPLEIWQQHLIEQILLVKGATLLYCNTLFEFKKKTFETRGEDYVNVNEINIEEELFEIVYNKSILNKYKIDIINNVIDFKLTNNKDFSKYESIGNPANNPIMFIGEKYGGNTKFSYGLNKNVKAFIDTKNSSRFLHQALSDISEPIYITNAYKTLDNDVDISLLIEEIEKIHPRQIIVLGDSAEQLVKQLHYKYHKIPHPQYYSRFKSTKQSEYTKLIKDCI